MKMEVAQPLSEIIAGAPSAATHKEKHTGVTQSAPQNKKPSLDQGDLRLQCIEALQFIEEEMSPDLSSNDLFYLARARDILQRLVDEGDADRSAFLGFL